MADKQPILAAVYPALAAAGLETASSKLINAERNNLANPVLTVALRDAAAAACAEHGVISDEHIHAVTELMCELLAARLPVKFMDVDSDIANVERTKAAHSRARRNLVIDAFGKAPLRVLAGFCKRIAHEETHGKNT